jgi:hypothetical protein
MQAMSPAHPELLLTDSRMLVPLKHTDVFDVLLMVFKLIMAEPAEAWPQAVRGTIEKSEARWQMLCLPSSSSANSSSLALHLPPECAWKPTTVSPFWSLSQPEPGSPGQGLPLPVLPLLQPGQSSKGNVGAAHASHSCSAMPAMSQPPNPATVPPAHPQTTAASP